MNWYKKAQQMSFGFEDDQSGNHDEVAEEVQHNGWKSAIDEFMPENERDLIHILQLSNIPWKKINDFPNADPIYVIYDNPVYVITDFDGVTEAHEWVASLSDFELLDYVPEQDFNADFWSHVSEETKYYHGTSEEALDSIMDKGLHPRSDTRGFSNRSTGAAVFASPTAENAATYYDRVLEIDVGQMARDRYTPPVSGEEPLQEEEMRNSLAYKIGLEDYIAEDFASEGLDPGTLIFYGPIPPKYLRVII